MAFSSALLLFSSLHQALALQKADPGQSTLGAFDSAVWPCDGIECVRKYVALPDAHYSWRDTGLRLSSVDPSTSIGWTGHVLNMTSQKWLTTDVVEHPIQWHPIVVVVPDNLESGNWANFIIDFGIDNYTGLGVNPWLGKELYQEIAVNRFDGMSPMARMVPGEAPYDPESPGFWKLSNATILDLKSELKEAVYKAGYLATHTRSVSVSLYCALNQVQVFKDDPEHKARYEDEIKAYSWVEFLKYGGDEPERIMELAVAKAVVRALDTVTDFTKQLPSGEITDFGVMGFSKLGMATWMTSAIDARVKAIAPMNLPVLGVPADLKQHAGVSLIQRGSPYADLPKWLYKDPDAGMRLYGIIELESWIDQVKVPVFYVQDTNDEWFDSNLGTMGSWLPLLPGPTRCLFVKANHDSAIMASLSGAAAFFRGQRLHEQAPEISYELNSSSKMLMVNQVSAHTPSSVRLVSAVSCKGVMSTEDTPSASFLDSIWTEAPEEVPAQGLRKWVADLGAAQADGINTILSERGSNTEGCLKGAFVRLEYPGPQPGYDHYQISTPVVEVLL